MHIKKPFTERSSFANQARFKVRALMFIGINLICLFFLLDGLLMPPATASQTQSGFDLHIQSADLNPVVSQPVGQSVREPERVLDCAVNPFGNVHDLFLEDEVFLSFTAVGGFDPDVTASMLNEGDNAQGKSQLLEAGGYYGDTDPNGQNLAEHAAGAADIDGDGHTEFFQSIINGNNTWYLLTYDDPNLSAPTYTLMSNRPYADLATASGNIIGSGTPEEQLVIAAVEQGSGSADGYVNVVVRNSFGVEARWSSNTNNRKLSSLLDVAVGDFNGDGQDDIGVLMLRNNQSLELILLEYDANHDVGALANAEYRLKPFAGGSTSFSPGIPSEIKLLTGRVNGDFRDEAVVVFNNQNVDDHLITVWSYSYDPINLTLDHLTEFDHSIAFAAGKFEMGAGMGEINGDFLRDEIAIVYPDESSLNIEILGAINLDAPTRTLSTLETWSYAWTEDTAEADFLDVSVGDLNNDGADEVVAAYDDSRGLEAIYVDWHNLTSNTLTGTLDLDPQMLNSPVSIAMGDHDDDSLRASYSGNCVEIQEDNVTSVYFRPPLWRNIQDPVDLYGRGFVGFSTTASEMEEDRLGSERSTATSGYIGAGISIDYKLASVELSAKATFAEEYAHSTGRGTISETTTTDLIEYGAGRNFAVGDESTYFCYSYNITQNGTPTGDSSSVRSCELVDSITDNTSLDVRDVNAAVRETNLNKTLEWIPTTRDWASLPLFCITCTAQSSTSGGATAGRAVDGDLTGEPSLMTSTNVENYPWWEVNLGELEEITKIRVWNREDLASCPANSCDAHLSNFYVFVSETPFQATDTPTDLLANPNVKAYSLDRISSVLSPTVGTDFPAGRVSTFLTLQSTISGTSPIEGQYVRVQIDRPSAQLQLAEVQIFGTNHVEPNRYPLDVRSGSNGMFQALLFNPYTPSPTSQWIDVRGELLWAGHKNDNSRIELDVGEGDSDAAWSRQTSQSSTSFASSSISQKKSVGYQIDFSGGAVAQIQAGGGQEFSTGIFTEQTHSSSWGESFEIGGWVKDFPQGSESQVITWYEECEYRITPYYYSITEESTFGYKSSHTVLDYIVTDRLGRTDDLTPCELGHPYNVTSNASNDESVTNVGQSVVIYPLLNDAGPEGMRIISVNNPANGSVSFTDRTITYSPNAGFAGIEQIAYTVSDGTTQSDATIEVTVSLRNVFLPSILR